MASDRVLVVGATGILRPAALELARAGRGVVGVARGRVALTALEAEGGTLVEVVPVDVTRPSQVGATVAPGGVLRAPVDAALVYAPQSLAAAFEQVLDQVRGRTVRLLTSSAADPVTDDADPPLAWSRGVRRPGEVRLLLGWTGDTADPRWHTPEEVSAAALAVLDHGRDTVLGRVRPWDERPS